MQHFHDIVSPHHKSKRTTGTTTTTAKQLRLCTTQW